MKFAHTFRTILILFLSMFFSSLTEGAAQNLPHVSTYAPDIGTYKDIVKITDDPTDKMVANSPKKLMPSELWEYLSIDVEEAKRLTAELVGFTAPEVVVKIAPEIKPGKYTFKDLEQHPGLKDLIPPEMQCQFRAAGPPLCGSIEDFEIVPTRQLHWHTRVCEATKRNLGKTKLDKDGYIMPRSWEGGFPFPRPSGEFKAQQVYYSFNKRPYVWDMTTVFGGESIGVDRNLSVDKYNLYRAYINKFKGRTLLPPFGWFDKRAETKNEFYAWGNVIYAPRANKGTATLRFYYDDPSTQDPLMIYVPSLRRIRKMTATDTQDPQGDLTYDDIFIISQKITPEKFPYKFEITAEREYLMPVMWNTAKTWIDTKNGYALRGLQFMRRPFYVLEMTQLDPNYVYSKRVLYIDKENFSCSFAANYDQKGRLYRCPFNPGVYMPESGEYITYATHSLQFDYIDLHSTFQIQLPLPGVFSRNDTSLEELIKQGK